MVVDSSHDEDSNLLDFVSDLGASWAQEVHCYKDPASWRLDKMLITLTAESLASIQPAKRVRGKEPVAMRTSRAARVGNCRPQEEDIHVGWESK